MQWCPAGTPYKSNIGGEYIKWQLNAYKGPGNNNKHSNAVD